MVNKSMGQLRSSGLAMWLQPMAVVTVVKATMALMLVWMWTFRVPE